LSTGDVIGRATTGSGVSGSFVHNPNLNENNIAVIDSVGSELLPLK